MNKIITLILLFTITVSYGQSLPIDFESGITTANFIDFNGGVATVIANPESNGINTSATVAQIIRNGGDVWAGSKIPLGSPIDFSTNNTISMKVFTSAPVGTVVKFKLEGNGMAAERDAVTTVTSTWETLTWDFTGEPTVFLDVVFMFDFGNVGDGSANSTFLFDDVEQVFGGNQLDLPVSFESTAINYAMTDFGGTVSTLITDPTDATNKVMQTIKTDQAASWGGTTIGTAGGFATNIPLTLTDSKMSVRVWSPDANITVRMKVEDSNDATHTCETDVMTTVAGGWEILIFDFTTEAAGTAALSFGLTNGWTYNKASIFFNFGVEGQAAGEKTYYFDDVTFGILSSTSNKYEVEGLDVFPNPATNQWTITSENTAITMVEIFDLQGKRLFSTQPTTDKVIINASDFANGIYISKIYTDLGVKSMKLIKQ